MCSRFCRLIATSLLALCVAAAGCSSDKEVRREPTPGAEKYLQDARAKLDAKRYTEARALLELAHEEGAPTEPTRDLSAELERALAQQALAKDDAPQAYEHLRRAAELEPDADQRFADLVAAVEAGQQAGAMAAELAPLASQAVELRTSSQKAQTLAAHLWDDAGEAARALPYYQWLHKVAPDDTGVAVRLGTLYLNEGKLAQARQLFEAIHRDQPDNVIAALKLADVYARLDDHAQATRLYEKLVEAYPERTGILFRYARYLDEQGDAERAARLRQRAREALPGVKRRKMRDLR